MYEINSTWLSCHVLHTYCLLACPQPWKVTLITFPRVFFPRPLLSRVSLSTSPWSTLPPLGFAWRLITWPGWRSIGGQPQILSKLSTVIAVASCIQSSQTIGEYTLINSLDWELYLNCRHPPMPGFLGICYDSVFVQLQMGSRHDTWIFLALRERTFTLSK